MQSFLNSGSSQSRSIDNVFERILNCQSDYQLKMLLTSNLSNDLSSNSVPQTLSLYSFHESPEISSKNHKLLTDVAFHVLDRIKHCDDGSVIQLYQKLTRILELNPYGELISQPTSVIPPRSLLAYAINIKKPQVVKILINFQQDVFHPSVKQELMTLLSPRRQASQVSYEDVKDIFNCLLHSGLQLKDSDIKNPEIDPSHLFADNNFDLLKILANNKIVILKPFITEFTESLQDIFSPNRDQDQLHILKINGITLKVNPLGFKNILNKIILTKRDLGCVSSRIALSNQNLQDYLSENLTSLSHQVNRKISNDCSRIMQTRRSTSLIETIDRHLPRNDAINPAGQEFAERTNSRNLQ